MSKKKPLSPAVNFTTFCEKATLKQIMKALKFYNRPFKAEEVLEYFANWTILNPNNCTKILINAHSNNLWKTKMTINNEREYMFADNKWCWQRTPATISEFISDILRYEDFDLLLTEKGHKKIYGK